MKLLSILGLCIFVISAYACTCRCNCKAEQGCKVIVHRMNSNNQLIRKQFCSTTNGDYYTDKILRDSVTAYLIRYQPYAVLVSQTDSIFDSKGVDGVDCDERFLFDNKDYHCVCDK